MIRHIFLCIMLFSLTNCSEAQKKSPTAKYVASPSVSLDTTWRHKIIRSEAEWAKILTPAQFEIARKQGTERPFTSPLNKIKEQGIFACAACKNPLFTSNAKFDSGTGWPSFFKPYSQKSVSIRSDISHGMTREEVLCARCDAHLGHVFDDGPAPTGLRYCMNGEVMNFQKMPAAKNLQTVVFAQGCFWCVEEIFEKIKGVEKVVSGYAGGNEKNPTYEQVGSGSTGHCEAIEITYDANAISYEQLLKVYFHSGDITQVNGQGPDQGRQYRSVIFYKDAAQKKQAETYMAQLQKSGKYASKIAVELLPHKQFYAAEAYHQDFVKRNPQNGYVRQVSVPRYQRAIKFFPELLRQ